MKEIKKLFLKMSVELKTNKVHSWAKTNIHRNIKSCFKIIKALESKISPFCLI